MLPFRSHWHLASKRHPERERRLAFAKKPVQGNAGQGPDNEQHGSEHAGKKRHGSAERVQDIAGDTRAHIESMQALAESALSSDFVLNQALDILERELRSDDRTDVREIIRKGRRYMEIDDSPDDAEEAATLRKELLQEIPRELRNAHTAAAFAEAYEDRGDRYDEIIENQIGDTDIGDIAEMDKEVSDEGRKRASLEELDPTGVNDPSLDTQWNDSAYDVDEWDEARIDKALHDLGINPTIDLRRGRENMSPDQQKTLDAMIRNLPPELQNPREATLEEKRRMVRNKLNAAKKLAVIERKDEGTETTLTNTKDVRESMATQRMAARENFARSIIARASALDVRFDKLQNVITSIVGSDDLAAIGKRFGLSAEGVKKRINDIHLAIKRPLRESKIGEDENALEDDPLNLPGVEHETFMQSAKLALQRLEDIAWLEEDNEDALIRNFLGDSLAEAKAGENWVSENAVRIERAAQALAEHPRLKQDIVTIFGTPDAPEALMECGEIAVRLRDREATDDDRECLRRFLCPEDKRKKLDAMLLAIESPTILAHMLRDTAILQADTTPNTSDERAAVRDAMGTSLNELKNQRLIRECALSQHLPMAEELERIGEDVHAKLALAESAEKATESRSRSKGELALRECRLQVQKVRDAVVALNAVRVTEEELGPKKSGGFRQSDSVIIIDPRDIPRRARQWKVSEEEARRRIVHHEEGHAVVDALVFRTGLMPKIIGVMSVVLQRQTASGETAEDTLRQVRGSWLIDESAKAQYLAFERAQLKLPKDKRGNEADERLAEMRAEGRMRDHAIDEALNRFLTWNEAGEPQDGSKFTELFAVIGGKDTGAWQRAAISLDEEEIEALDRPELMRHLGDDEEAAPETADEGAATNSGRMLAQEITEADNTFLKIRNFIARHKTMPGVGAFTSWTDEWEEAFKTDIKHPFFDEDNFNEQTLEKRLDILKERFFAEADKQINAVNLAEADTTGASGGAIGGILSIWKSIDWVSINDIIKMCQSAAEDVQRMWKRRGERNQSGLGQTLTSWIPKWIPYAGQLENEFRRREQASELENVKVWKDAYDNLDPFGLQDLLKGCNDKDQVRAIVELLIDKGRLNFNDPELWRTLSRLSGIKIPEDAMQASDIARDKWMQKMVTTIWTDTDKFFEWQQKNNSGIKSGKDKFTPTGDQLANINGGMRNALGRQLELWVETQDKGERMPDEVNPHLYEELLHYAMRNGKMTMEDKLFYLVQGVRYGILSIDRLRALAGQTGGVLNAFPMIDYFTADHNSFPEIEALGKRIQESSTGKARFQAGQKTTLWLHLELLRDENARARMSKATSGTRAEGLDHEDIPTIMAQADYKTVERLTDIISGSRLVMSPEGAKNAYTGFGTKFKILARLVELGKFTQGDAMEAAKSISAYIHYDNIITRVSTEKDVRNELSWSQMNQQGPSTGSYTVKDYRDPNNAFVSTLLQKLGPAINWAHIGVAPDQYFRKPGDTEVRSKKDQATNFSAAKTFEQEITKALADPANRKILTDTLKLFADKLHEENGKDKLDQNVMREYFKERAQHGK